MLRSKAVEKILNATEAQIAVESKNQGVEDEIIEAQAVISRKTVINNINTWMDLFLKAGVLNGIEDDEVEDEETTKE